MRSFMTKSIFTGVLLLLGGVAVGGDVLAPYLAQCVAQLEEDTDLAVKFCRSQRARAILAPGSTDCLGSWRLIDGRITCSKSDSASAAAASGVGFSEYFSSLIGPVSIRALSDLYAGRSAGEGDRFRIRSKDDGGLEIVGSHTGTEPDRLCVLQPGIHRCSIQGAFSGSDLDYYRRFRNDYTYTLQLDGLLVEKETHRKACSRTLCLSGNCMCMSYIYPPPVKSQFLHFWQ